MTDLDRYMVDSAHWRTRTPPRDGTREPRYAPPPIRIKHAAAKCSRCRLIARTLPTEDKMDVE